MVSLRVLIAAATVATTAATIPVASAAAEAGRSDASASGSLTAVPPLPAGFKVLYVFPGVRTDSSDGISATVHCTNLDKKGTTMLVECINWSGVLKGSVSPFLPANYTGTVTCGDDTDFYHEDALAPLLNDMDQGYIRVSSDEAKKLACSAQVLDNTASPPSFIHDLIPYNGKAKH